MVDQAAAVQFLCFHERPFAMAKFEGPVLCRPWEGDARDGTPVAGVRSRRVNCSLGEANTGPSPTRDLRPCRAPLLTCSCPRPAFLSPRRWDTPQARRFWGMSLKTKPTARVLCSARMHHGFAALAVAFTGNVGATAYISQLPTFPTSDAPIAIRVEDSLPYSGFVVGAHTAAVNGTVITVQGCVGSGGFATPGGYAATASLPPLPPANYTVNYFRTACAEFPPPMQLVGTGSLEVRNRSDNWPPPSPSTPELYEYYHRTFDHYFITVFEPEKLAIETGTFSGWERVGPWSQYPPVARLAFHANDASDGRLAVCRFFSTAFGAKSSHFYTSDSAECESVKKGATWQYEGIAGYVWPANGDGTCTRGVAVFRLYNNGSGGAPNHRYTIDPSIRGNMIARGWVPEGLGEGVAFCAPRPS
jgi:hypothetical protein